MAGVVLLAAWYCGLSAWGAYQWRSETRIFSNIVRHDPDSIVGTAVYTYSLEREGRFREAAQVEMETLNKVFGSEAWRSAQSALDAMHTDPRISFRARRNQGTNEDPRIWIAGLYAQLASCLQKAGENDAAYRMLLIGERVWSNHTRIHLGLGYFAGMHGDYVEAARRYRMALDIDRNNLAANSGLGYSYAGMQRWSEAADAFRRWLKLDPESREARDRLRDAEERVRRSGR